MSAAALLSVVIPVHDEEASLEALHRELDAAVGGWPGGLEIVFVDDGSRDASRARLRAIAQKDPRVRVLALDAQHGQSAALDAGFRAARGELIATLDADLQNDPADLPRLLAAVEHADVVCGVRVARRDGCLRRLVVAHRERLPERADGRERARRGLLAARDPQPLPRAREAPPRHAPLPPDAARAGGRARDRAAGRAPAAAPRRSKYGIADRLFAGLVDVFAVRWMKSRRLDYQIAELQAAQAERHPAWRSEAGSASEAGGEAKPRAVRSDGSEPL